MIRPNPRVWAEKGTKEKDSAHQSALPSSRPGTHFAPLNTISHNCSTDLALTLKLLERRGEGRREGTDGKDTQKALGSVVERPTTGLHWNAAHQALCSVHSSWVIKGAVSCDTSIHHQAVTWSLHVRTNAHRVHVKRPSIPGSKPLANIIWYITLFHNLFNYRSHFMLFWGFPLTEFVNQQHVLKTVLLSSILTIYSVNITKLR